MLGHQVISEVVRQNVWKLDREGRLLLSLVGDRRSGGAGLWEGYPCYWLDFMFNDEALIRAVGDSRDFFPEQKRLYTIGLFRIAVNAPVAKERIVKVYSPEDARLVVKNRLESTVAEYNRRHGFSVNAPLPGPEAKLNNTYLG
ncbi:MAG TPA: hypothetical protein VJA18_03745 [Candidatus Nanoarchaeia archaeon]|nr:hypothetical protein [Candidatus Nanoarchaeia archaeon]